MFVYDCYILLRGYLVLMKVIMVLMLLILVLGKGFDNEGCFII